MNKLLVILGPTATGKTDLALSLAKKFNGEIVSCDSRQVYRGLDIGTGKLPFNSTYEVKRMRPRRSIWEIDGIRIWMYDVVSPKKQYTVYDFVQGANKVIDGIFERGGLPIIVGGTGFYLKAIPEGLPNLAIPIDRELRKKLEKLSLVQLQKKLQKLSPKRWDSLNNSDRENPRRLVRAIELAMSKHEGDPSSDLRRTQDDHARGGSNVLKIGLTAPRDILYQRVDGRVVGRINQGMIEEAERLHKGGLTFKRMKQLGLEYGILADFLSGKITKVDELIKIMQGKIHGFVRRQLTWFKKEKDIVWFDITGGDFPVSVEKLVSKWYHQANVSKDRYIT